MAIKGLESHYNDYNARVHLISEADCEKIINAALDIAETIGIKVGHKKSIDLMVGAGCRYKDGIMYIPRELVFKSIKEIPNFVDLYDAHGNLSMHIGGDNAYFGTGPTNPYINDFATGERRFNVLNDVVNTAKVVDACKNISFTYNLADPSDVPKPINDVYSMRAMLENTTKVIGALAVDSSSLREQFELVLATYNNDWDAFRAKPRVIVMPMSPISPLCMPGDEDMEKVFFCCENGIPMIFPNALQPGMTAPVTLAGASAVSLAEQFFGFVLTRLINKDCPYVAHAQLYTVDMKNMNPCYGTPEHCMGDIIGPDIFRYLDIPLESTAGGTEAKIVDEQLAIENTFTIFSNALSGGQMVHDIGFMDSGITTYLDSITISNEIVGYAMHVKRGIEVSDDTIDLELIKEVGHGGNYMVEEDTIERYRDITWIPDLIDHNNYSAWTSNGSKDMRTRVHERTQWILENHKPDVNITPEMTKQMDEIIKRANERVEKGGVKRD